MYVLHHTHTHQETPHAFHNIIHTSPIAVHNLTHTQTCREMFNWRTDKVIAVRRFLRASLPHRLPHQKPSGINNYAYAIQPKNRLVVAFSHNNCRQIYSISFYLRLIRLKNFFSSTFLRSFFFGERKKLYLIVFYIPTTFFLLKIM